MSKLLLEPIKISNKCKDITGQKFNKLTAIHPVAQNRKHGVVWLLKCDCGSLHNSLLANLTSGQVTSCGCNLKPKVGRHYLFKDITNEKFTKLTAIRTTGNRRGKAIEWECLCDCGKITFVAANNLRSGSVKSCGCLKPIRIFHNKKERARENRLKKKYNIDLNYYKQLLKSQQNCCAICYTEFTSQFNTHIDHDHETNQVRGLLCNNCNRGIGFLQDNPKVILNAYNYLSYKLKKAS